MLQNWVVSLIPIKISEISQWSASSNFFYKSVCWCECFGTIISSLDSRDFDNNFVVFDFWHLYLYTYLNKTFCSIKNVLYTWFCFAGDFTVVLLVLDANLKLVCLRIKSPQLLYCVYANKPTWKAFVGIDEKNLMPKTIKISKI